MNPWNKPSQTFKNALKPSQNWDLSQDQILNDNRNMIRINLLLLYLSQGFFFTHAIVFTFLSFLGAVALFHLFRRITTIPDKLLLISIFLIPSTLLWTSSILKESWLFFSMGFFLFFLERFVYHKNLSSLFFLLLFLLLFISVKLYVLLAMIPAFSFLLLHHFSKVSQWKSFVLSHLILFSLGITFKGKTLLFLLREKLELFKQLAIQENAGSFFKIKTYDTWFDFLLQLPNALYNVFIRPIFPPNMKVLTIMSSIEAAGLMLLFLLPFVYFQKAAKRQFIIALAAISFVLCLSILIGMTTPVLGAIVRYKVPLIPFYLLAVLTFVSIQRVPILKKIK